ncbi:MAG: hypothetical protein JWR16_2716 [Nevskia sp.]|nr:hypothetical protein [Nevskia sp.]
MNCVIRHSRTLLAATVWLAGVALAQSDPVPEQPPGVYKWADRNGVLHYDDASLTEPRLTLDILDARRIAPAPDQGAPRSFAAEVGRRCALTRDRLQNYQGARALYGRDPFGNVYPLSSTQTALAIGALGRDESRYCGPDAAKKLYLAAPKPTSIEAAK